MRHKTQIPAKAQAEEAYVQSHKVGDIAAGTIVLRYRLGDGAVISVHVPYDTFGGPDGLETRVAPDLGMWLRGEKQGPDDARVTVNVLATREVLDLAKEARHQVLHEITTRTGIYEVDLSEVDQ